MILVAGGSGRLGTELTNRLTARGEDVRVLVRDLSAAPSGVDVAIGDVRDADAVDRAVRGTSGVVSAVTGFLGGRHGPQEVDSDGNANLIRSAVRHDAKRFVLVSIAGASPIHPMELGRMKHRAETALSSTDLLWTIIRPTVYMETWTEILAQPLRKSGKGIVFGRGQNPINFVSVRDVAAEIESALDSTSSNVVELGGPVDLSLDDLVRMLMRGRGAQGQIRHVPRPALRVLSSLVRRIQPNISRMMSTAVFMDTADMTFDGKGSNDVVGRTSVAKYLASATR